MHRLDSLNIARQFCTGYFMHKEMYYLVDPFMHDDDGTSRLIVGMRRVRALLIALNIERHTFEVFPTVRPSTAHVAAALT